MDLMDILFAGKLGGNKGGGGEKVVKLTGDTAVITPEANTIYKCGYASDGGYEGMVSLTINNGQEEGAFLVVFFTTAGAVQLNVGDNIYGLESFVPKENMRYEIHVLDGWATVGEWEVW